MGVDEKVGVGESYRRFCQDSTRQQAVYAADMTYFGGVHVQLQENGNVLAHSSKPTP